MPNRTSTNERRPRGAQVNWQWLIGGTICLLVTFVWLADRQNRAVGDKLICSQRRIRAFAIALTAYPTDHGRFPELSTASIEGELSVADYNTGIRNSDGVADWRCLDCFGRPLGFRRISREEVLIISAGRDGNMDDGGGDDLTAVAYCGNGEDANQEELNRRFTSRSIYRQVVHVAGSSGHIRGS